MRRPFTSLSFRQWCSLSPLCARRCF